MMENAEEVTSNEGDTRYDDSASSVVSVDSIEAEASAQAPIVEKIDLSGILPNSDDQPKSSGYNSEIMSATPKSIWSTGRWVASDVTGLQDSMRLDASLGTPRLTERQHNKSLEESGRLLMDEGNFDEASLLLEAIYPITFRQQLMLAECYLYSGKLQNVKVSISHAARLMTLCLRLRIHDVSAAIKKALAKKDFVKALVLLHCSPRFGYLKLVPNDAVRYIERRVADYSHAISGMVKKGGKFRDYAEWFVTQNMLDILLLFREITKARFQKKIDCEARILTYFGLCYRSIEDHQKSLECFQQGMEVLNLTHNDRVMNSKLFGILLHNTGLVYESLEEYVGAESHYVQAYEALSFADDFESQKEKEKTLQVTETNLKVLRERMQNALDANDASSVSTDELLQELEDGPESIHA